MPGPARRETDRVAGEGLDGHRLHVLGDDAADGAVVFLNDGEEVPELELADHLLAVDGDALVVLDLDGLEAADLLVERVEQLLAGGGAGEGGAVEERAAEAAEVEQTLRRAVEGHAHAVEHVDDARGRVGHALDRRLVGEEVAAVHGLFEVHLGRVALPLGVHAGVDAALRAHGVRPLHGHEREEVHRYAGLAELDDGHETAEPAADDDDSPNLARFAVGRAFGSHISRLSSGRPTGRPCHDAKRRSVRRIGGV